MNTHLNSPMSGEGRDATSREVNDYYAEHPESPAAARRPRIVVDGHRYVALLGSSINGGVFGFGSSVSAALKCFDELYAKCNPKLAADLLP